ncbi:MAG: serine hydrolase [Gaiellaceae bacterium]
MRSQTYGFAELASQRLVTPATQFEIGSIGKTFTAMAVLQLRDEGRTSSRPRSHATCRGSRFLEWRGGRSPSLISVAYRRHRRRNRRDIEGGVPGLVITPTCTWISAECALPLFQRRLQGAPRQTDVRKPGSARTNARPPGRPAQEQAAGGASPDAQAGRPARAPTRSCQAAAAPKADPATAAATSYPNCGRGPDSPTRINRVSAVPGCDRIASASARSIAAHLVDQQQGPS